MAGEIGTKNSTVINDTAIHTGCWRAIRVIANAGFTTLIDATRTGSVAGITFPANHELLGVFTTITLSGGSVMAYD